MDSEKIGKIIKRIRMENNFSQQQFASRYGVTYQAVSKWENGKNIPDILLLKKICNDFDIKIDELLEGNFESNDKSILRNFNIKYFFVICLFACLTIIFSIYLFFGNHDFKLKRISSSCENFTIYGNIAYNDKKSSISISEIDYCDKEDKTVYKRIECSLYEEIENTKILITSCETKENLMLVDFLEDIRFGVDNYKQNCKNYINNSLYLEIRAIDENDKQIVFEVPLELKDNCQF